MKSEWNANHWAPVFRINYHTIYRYLISFCLSTSLSSYEHLCVVPVCKYFVGFIFVHKNYRLFYAADWLLYSIYCMSHIKWFHWLINSLIFGTNHEWFIRFYSGTVVFGIENESSTIHCKIFHISKLWKMSIRWWYVFYCLHNLLRLKPFSA